MKTVLAYDPSTGFFTWNNRPDRGDAWNRLYAGKRAGRVCPRGYVQIKVNGTLYYSHRLAWLWITGAFPVSQIDHIDGHRANNAESNLREATPQMNAANSRTKITNKSGLKGVCFISRIHAFQASIKVNGKSLHLGYHATAEEAHSAYCKAAAEHFREFARAS